MIRPFLHARSAVLAAALGLAGATAATAQLQPDARWLAWRGCWEPVIAGDDSRSGAQRLVCVVPAGRNARIITVVNGAILASDLMQPSDSSRRVEQDGCAGTERITWAANGARLYRTAELDCQGGLHQSVSQLFAIAGTGEWLEVQGVNVQSRSGVRVLRYREVATPAGLPGEIASELADGAGAGLARTAAAGVAGMDDVIEASHHAAPGVVEAWLAETGRAFHLDGRTLARLARRGVPGNVIDMMVALSYPRAFAMSPADGSLDVASDKAKVIYGGGFPGVAMPSYGRLLNDCRYDRRAYLRGACHDALGYGSEFGQGFHGLWYWNRGPVIIVALSGGSSAASTHGRVVKGEGYRPGSGSTSSSVAGRPRIDPPSNGSNAGGMRNDGSGSAASGSSAGATAGEASSTAGGDRTAKPRP